MHDLASKAPLSVNDAVEQGIEAAKSGNRLLARWQLESVAVGHDVRPEVWMWLAWVAESPTKAQAYLKNVTTDPRFESMAVGGLQWLSFLTGESVAEIAPPVKPHSGSQPLMGERTSAIDPAQLAAALEMLLKHESLALQDADTVAVALTHFKRKPALGFSDCLVLEIARKAGHTPLGTFDKGLGKLAGAQPL